MAARCAVLASAMFAIAQACDNWYNIQGDDCWQACLGPMVGICPTAALAATQGFSQGTCSDDTDYTVKGNPQSVDMGACLTHTTWTAYVKPGAVVGVIIGIVIGCLCLCGLCVAGFILLRKRRAQGAGENAPIINVVSTPAPAGAVYAQPAQAAGQPVQYGTAMPPASVVPQAVPAQPAAPHCVY